MSRNRKRSLHNCAIQEIPLSHTKDSRKLRRRGQCSHPAEKSGQDEGWKNRFGHTAYGKVVLDEFVKQRKPASKSVDVELEIVNGYMTDAELEKTVAKVCTMVNAESFDPEGPPHRVPQLGEAHEEPDGVLRQTRGALQRTSQGARKGKWAIARVCNRGSRMRHLDRSLPLSTLMFFQQLRVK